MNTGRWSLAWGAFFCLSGCAGTGGSPADRLLEQGDFDAAIVAFEAERARQPDDAEILRNLGIAQFEAGRTGASLGTLEQARRQDPDNSQTLYFLGRAAERAEKYDLALDAYTTYLDRTGKDERVVRSRIQAVSLQKSTADVMRALAQERDLSAAAIPENTVAVADFENSLEVSDLNALGHGLAAVLVTDLSQVEELRVLERARLRVLLGEIDLGTPPRAPAQVWDPIETVRGTKQRLSVLLRPDRGEAYYNGPIDGQRTAAYAEAVRQFQADHSLGVDGVPGPQTWTTLKGALPDDGPPATESVTATGVVSAQTAPRIGRVLGASRLVQGTFAASGANGTDQVQLGAAVLDVKSGTPEVTGEPVVGNLADVLQLEKTLVYQVLESMGIDPSGIDRRRIDKLPTRNFLAFLAYSKGLYLEEEGQMVQATESYREAVRLDPSFQFAREELETITVTEEDRQTRDRTELQGAVRQETLPGDRLIRTGAWGGIGPAPDFEVDRSQEPTTDAIKVGDGAVIIVGGELPPGNGSDGRGGR